MYSFLNNAFVESAQAKIHVSDLAIQRGYGIFDFFRIKEGIPLYLDDYLNRFTRSADRMGLAGLPDRERLKSVILELIRLNGMPEAGVKLILTGGYSPDAYTPVEGNFIVTQHALTLPSVSMVEKGISILTHTYRREFPDIKSINYLTGVWLQRKLKEAGAEDVLYHLEGEVSEFPRCNFFIVDKGGKLATPASNILQGITRMKVLEVARASMGAEERTVTVKELAEVREAFLTSTTKGILPIVKIDGKPVGDGRPGPVSQILREQLREKELGELGKALASR